MMTNGLVTTKAWQKRWSAAAAAAASAAVDYDNYLVSEDRLHVLNDHGVL